MEKQSVDNKGMEKADNTTVYEVSYLILPSLTIDQAIGKETSLKSAINSFGSEIISGESPILIDLAYPMTKVVQTVRHKETTGYFGWVKFETSPEAILSVKKVLDADMDILRYLIVKTVRENTLLEGKMRLRKEEKTRKAEEDALMEVPEVVKEIVPEDLDKSIDELVVV